MKNQARLGMAAYLRKAGRRNGAPIWSRLSREALKPSAARRTVNLNRLDRLTEDGDAVAFAGKVLGTGSISHGITLFSFSISNGAARKVLAAGGEIRDYRSMMESFPTGSGVKLLG